MRATAKCYRRAVRFSFAGFASVCFACASPPQSAAPTLADPPAATEPETASEPTESAPPPEVVDAGIDAAAIPPPVATLLGLDPKIVEALENESVFHGRDMDPDAIRKLDPDGKYSTCAKVKLGAADGWICEVSVPHSEQTGHSVFELAVVRMASAKLKELYRIPYQARALDFPEAIYATLRAEWDDTTGTLKLTDGAFPCAKATDSEDTSLEFQRVVNRLCKARGTHVFQGTTFTHKDKPAALKWKGGARRSATSGF